MSLLGIQQTPIQIKEDYDRIGHFRDLQSGAGINVFRVNNDGVFIGGDNYDDAPINFSYDGVQQLGVSNVKLDGNNKRIIINDGTNDRVLIGYLAGKF